jgi:prepilin-type N-terminal cleavage/methylation domain-containing protein
VGRIAERGRWRRGAGWMDGFTLVELIVTIALATIIFAAMVPLFYTVLHRTSGDHLRNVAQNIAQDRIEQIRLLNYEAITQTNLNDPPSPASSFGDGRFGPVYYVAGSSKPYNVSYSVVDRANDKKVTVTVAWSPTDYTTTMQTIVKNPAPMVTSTTSSMPSPSPTITGLSITVSFKNWTEVKSPGVVVKRVQTNVTPNATVTPTPVSQMPGSSHQTVTWAGLTGGTAFTYYVTCYSQYITATSPAFHLLKNARLKFDTHPGGS